MSGYIPGSGKHAIEQAVVGVRVFNSVDDAVFAEASNLAGSLAGRFNLPGRVQLDPMSLVFGRQIISGGYAQTAQLAPGLLFQRVQDTGEMEEELTLERNAVTYRTRNYKRWDDVAKLIENIICPVVNVLSGGSASQISVLELRCIDRFVSRAEVPPELASLIRADSEHVTSSLLKRTSLLHLHSGWFEDEDESGRTLININIDLSDDAGGTRVANILQVVSVHASGVGEKFASDRQLDEVVKDAFTSVHMRDKKLLASLLTDQMQEAIDLQGARGLGA